MLYEECEYNIGVGWWDEVMKILLYDCDAGIPECQEPGM